MVVTSAPSVHARPVSKPRRHLPIVGQGSASSADEAADRPRWHYAALGAGATMLAWLLLAAIVNAVIGSMARAQEGASELSARALVVGANVVVLFVCAALGGFLVTRLTGRTDARDAAASGALAVTLGYGVALAQPVAASGSSWAAQLGLLVVLWALGGGAGAAGGLLGRRGRARASATSEKRG